VSVTAVVLAAGAARRLGRPKQLEQVGGVPLVARALAAAVPADDRLVLLGSGAALIRPTVQRYGPSARVVVVEDWRLGMGHVLASAFSELPLETEAIVVLLADQPYVTAEAVAAIVEAWRRTGESWLCAAYAGRPGHPHLFDASWFPALAGLQGDDGARAVTGGSRPYPVDVPGDDRDIDDESDLIALRADSRLMS
jgi:molybdenum cofactor cytidylyltransferase